MWFVLMSQEVFLYFSIETFDENGLFLQQVNILTVEHIIV